MGNVALSALAGLVSGAALTAAMNLLIAAHRRRAHARAAAMIQPLALKESSPGAPSLCVDAPDGVSDPDLVRALDVASQLQQESRHDKAIERLTTALASAKDDKQRSILYRRIGNSLMATSQINLAREHYNKAVEFARSAGDPFTLGMALANLGVVYLQMSDLKSAETVLKEALGISESAEREVQQAPETDHGSGPRFLRAMVLNSLGELHHVSGDTDGAKAYYEEAVTIHRQINCRVGEAVNLASLADVSRRDWQAALAVSQYEQALTISREIGDRIGEAGALGGLGKVYRDMNKLDLAEQCHKQALQIQREIGDELGWATSLHNLGKVYRRQGDLRRAEEHHEEALAIYRAFGSRVGEANACGNLGNVWLASGEIDRAKRYYQKALTIDEEIGNRPGEAYNTGALGAVARALARSKDELVAARALYGQAIAICEDFHSAEAARCVLEMRIETAAIDVDIARSAGKLEDAWRLCREALDLCEELDTVESRAAASLIRNQLLEIDKEMLRESAKTTA